MPDDDFQLFFISFSFTVVRPCLSLLFIRVRPCSLLCGFRQDLSIYSKMFELAAFSTQHFIAQ